MAARGTWGGNSRIFSPGRAAGGVFSSGLITRLQEAVHLKESAAGRPLPPLRDFFLEEKRKAT